MSVVEKEIVEATAFDPPKEYANRQDYLAALARAVDNLDDETFDGLSNEATDWFNTSVRAMNNKKKLPDFEGAEEEPAEEEVDPETGEITEEHAEAEEMVEEAEEAPTPPPKAKKPAAKAAKPEKAAAPARRPKGVPPKKLDHPPIERNEDPETFELDEFGSVRGSKNSAAAAMLKKGCRMADVTESIGGTYYNLVQRLVKQGHHLEKSSNGMLKLTHKDEAPKKGKKVK